MAGLAQCLQVAVVLAGAAGDVVDVGGGLAAAAAGVRVGELLDLTGDIAHDVERLAVPLTSYLIGVAVGRGAVPPDALRIVAGLLPEGKQ